MCPGRAAPPSDGLMSIGVVFLALAPRLAARLRGFTRAWTARRVGGATIILYALVFYPVLGTFEIVGVFTPARFRALNGRSEATPWAGRFRDYIPSADRR